MQRYKNVGKLSILHLRYYYIHHHIAMSLSLNRFLCFTALLSSCGISTHAFTARDAADALHNTAAYHAVACFTVSMPQLNDDVVYSLNLNQIPNLADTLLGLDYLVSWHSTSGTPTPIEGFSAYCGTGDHFRYNGHRLQEYHMAADTAPFQPNLNGIKGVQCTAQFVDLLPFSIADEIDRMLADSAYTITTHTDTLVDGRRVDVLSAVLMHNGVVAKESEYIFERDTRRPLRIRHENSPGSISEQSVEIIYTESDTPGIDTLTEAALIDLYPDVFANLRQNNFRIQSLPGTRLPGFALVTPTRERYSRGVNDPFRAPTAVAFLNASDAMTAQVIDALRSAAAGSPVPFDILWVFTDKEIDAVEAATGQPREGEHILMSGRGLMRDCGAADLPAVVLCDADAVVRNVIVGFNNDMASDVIQMISLLDTH